MSVLNGHATHYWEGVPGNSPTNIVGLDAKDVYGPDACGTASAGGAPVPEPDVIRNRLLAVIAGPSAGGLRALDRYERWASSPRSTKPART